MYQNVVPPCPSVYMILSVFGRELKIAGERVFKPFLIVLELPKLGILVPWILFSFTPGSYQIQELLEPIFLCDLPSTWRNTPRHDFSKMFDRLDVPAEFSFELSYFPLHLINVTTCPVVSMNAVALLVTSDGCTA